MMELKDTVDMMLSDDYKERLKAEYLQTKIRHEKLQRMLGKWDMLNFVPLCPKYVLSWQLRVMKGYLEILEERADIEGIELPSVKEFVERMEH